MKTSFTFSVLLNNLSKIKIATIVVMTFVFLLNTGMEVQCQTITIPAANTNNGSVNDPYGTYWGYERTAMIYTAAQIGTTGTINSVGFYVNSVSSPGQATNVRIYMKTRTTLMTTNTTYATEISGATLVYGPTSIPAASFVAGTWYTVNLTTPFNYTGNNLEIIIETNSTGGGSESLGTSKQFRYSTPGNSTSYQYWNADNTAPTGTGTRSTSRPNVQLTFASAACSGTPSAGTATITSSTGCPSISFTLNTSGLSSGLGISYLWEYSANGSTDWTSTGITTTSYTISTATTMYYRLKTTCSGSGLSNYTNVVSYTVTVNGSPALLTMTDSYGDGWNGGSVTLTSVGGLTFGPYTISSGSSGTQSLCLPDDCYNVVVAQGSYPGEMTWTITNGATTYTTGNGYSGTLNNAFSTGSVTCTVPYKATFTAMNTGSATWCTGEVRNVTVTITNSGSATWTNSSPEINIGCKWNTDADYIVRVDANNLAPGASATYTLAMTAPLTTGSNNLTFDLVNEGNFWFANQGNGSVVYTSPAQTISSCEMTVPSTGNNSYTVCSGNLYDHAGSTGEYSSSVDGYTVLYPATAGTMMSISGSTSGEACCDYIQVYNGVGLGGTLLWSGYAGIGAIPTIISSDASGALTVRFYSDSSVTGAGFSIAMSCYTPSVCSTCPTYNFGIYTPTITPATHASSTTDAAGCKWYAFNVTSGSEYIFSTCSNGGTYSGDSKMWLYDNSCAAISSIDDYCGTGPQITWTATYTGVVYLQMAHYSFSSTVSWTLAYWKTPPPGENCSNAQNLAGLSSPYSATTTGYADDISTCHTGYPDRIFYIDVPAGSIVNIWQSSNTFDSYHYMGYGGSCPGTTQIVCMDDSDTQVNSWTNTTGSTQTVYFVVDGYSGSGDFVLEWTIALPLCTSPTLVTVTPNSSCGSVTSQLNATSVGNTINWFTVSSGGSSIGSSASGVNFPVSVSSTTTYYAEATGGSCTAVRSAGVSVTINSIPNAPSSVTASPSSICPGGNSLLNATSAGNSINWYTVSSGGSVIGSSASGSNFSVSPSAITTYYAEASSPSGAGNMLGNPVHSNSSSGSYTLGYSFTPNTNLTVTSVRRYFGTKISIWDNAGTLIMSQAVTGIDGTWTQTTLATPITLTAGVTYRIGAYTNGGNYYWNTTAMSSTFANGVMNAAYEIGGDAFPTGGSSPMWWYVDLAYSFGTGCTSARTPVTVSINANVGITSATAATSPICSASTTTITANGVTGTNAVITWYTGTGGTGTNLGTSNPLTVGPGTYYARVTGDCGTAVEASVTVASKINVGITSATATASPICPASTTTVTANGVAGTNAVVTWWSATGGTGTNYGTGTSKVVGPGTYFARVTGDCGSAVEASVIVASNTESTAPTSISGTTTVCNGVQTILTAVGGTDGTGASYQWYAGGCASGSVLSVTNTLTVTPGSSTTYFVRRTGTCNTTTCASQLVTVNPLLPASVTIAASQNPTCAGVTGIFTATPTNGGNPSYQWLLNGTGVGVNSNEYSNANVLNGDIISCVMTSNATCATGSPATSNAITMTVAAPPTTALIGNDYVWSGNVDANWETVANWLVYDGTNYAPAVSIPDNTKNVFLRAYAPCVSNPAATTASATVSCHNLTIETGLSLGNISHLNVSGNWNNSGTFAAGTGTVAFVGSTVQTINAGNSNFNNLVLANTAATNSDIVIASNIVINGNLSLNSGILNANAHTVNFGSAASVTENSSSSFVHGKMIRTGATAFKFPTGDVINRDMDGDEIAETHVVYTPFEVNPESSATVEVEYFYDNTGMPDWWEHGGNMDATLHHVSDREHWIVNSDQSLINTKIYWVANNHTDGAFCVHGFDDGIAIEFIASDLAVTYWSSTLWRNAVGTVSGDHNNGSITSSYIPFGYKASTVITFGSKHNLNPLPVELIAYKSECKGESAELYWATASEVNNDYFVLQRSTDAQNFTEIARIIGHGNSNVINYYSYQDTEQKSGTVYYRLLQFDYDGASEILGVVQSNCSDNIESVASVDVSPNPFRNDLNISLNNFNTDSKVVYEIVDMYGRVLVSEEIIGTSHKTIYLQNLKPGLYMLRVIDGDKVFVNKIIKN